MATQRNAGEAHSKKFQTAEVKKPNEKQCEAEKQQ